MNLWESKQLHRWQQLARTSLELGLIVTTGLLALAGFVRVLPALIQSQDQIDFGAYYVAARVLNAHGQLYRPDEMRAAADTIHFTGYIYPPFFAVLLRPLAWVPYQSAEVVWMGLNVAFLCLSIILLVRVLALRPFAILLLISLALLLPAVYDTLLLGQVGLLINLLLVGALMFSLQPGARHRNHIAAGVLLGIAVTTKAYPAVMGLVYIIHRRVMTLVAMGITVLLTFVIGILWGGGWSSTLRWGTEVLPTIANMPPFPSNQSIRGVVERFFSYHEFSVPVLTKDNVVTVRLSPIVNLPIAGSLIIYVGIIAVLGMTISRMLRRVQQHEDAAFLLNYALAIPMMLLITPVVWDLYLVQLLIPLVVLGYYGYGMPAQRWTLLTACFLLILQRYWRWMLLTLQTPWLMLFGFLSVLLIWQALRWMPSIALGHTRRASFLKTTPR